MTVSNIAITNPALAIAGIAAIVPLVVHLLTRRTTRVLTFPSLRFLKSARASQARLYRLRHLLLLLLRTLAVLLLWVAFLKPVLHLGAVREARERALPSAVVVVLDASASMGHRSMGGTAFARGKTAARALLGTLGAADKANLIIAGAFPVASFTEPSEGRAMLERDVESAELSGARADMDAALAEAAAQLAACRNVSREIHVISDFQRSNWAAVGFGDVPPDVKLTFLPVGAADTGNLFVSDVTVSPPFPTVRERVVLSCRVVNTGAEAAAAPIELRVGDGVLLKRETRVAARSAVTEVFQFALSDPGQFEGTIRLPGDALPVDDERYFVVPVAQRMPVLVLCDAADREPTASGRLIARGLDPFPDRSPSAFETTLSRSGSGLPLAAGLQHVIVVTDTLPFDGAMLTRLLAYMRDGGSVVFFLSSAGDRTNLLALESASGGDLTLPFRPLGAVSVPADAGGAVTLAQANFDDPIFEKFREVEELGKVRFFRHFGVERVEGGGRTLARFSDGAAALATKAVGAGWLSVCNFSVAPDASDFARKVLFVPFLHELLKSARPRGNAIDRFTVGRACSTAVTGMDDFGQVRFLRPDGAAAQALFNAEHGNSVVVFSETPQPGFYRVWRGDRRLASAAVNVDERESDLDLLDAGQLHVAARAARGKVLAASGVDGGTLRNLRHGRPLWHWCVVGMLVCLVVEQGLWAWWRG